MDLMRQLQKSDLAISNDIMDLNDAQRHLRQAIGA